MSDETDASFLPEVDLSDKPWFDVVSVDPPASVETSASENMSVALNTVPLNTQKQMGHKIEDFLQECTYNGRKCIPR